MTVLIMVGTSVLIGWLAQTKKGRTGAAWGVITMLVLVPIWFFLYMLTAMTHPELYRDYSGWWALAIMVCGPVGIIMALIVWTLPNRKRSEG